VTGTHVEDEIQSLHRRFLAASNSRDFAGVADCFAEPAFHAPLDAESVLTDTTAFIALLEKPFVRLEADNIRHTTIGSVEALRCGDRLAAADARDVTRLRKDGSAVETIDGHYIARRTEDGWKFAAVVSFNPGCRDA